MQNSQFDLCCKLLRRLEQVGVLEELLLIGSWCQLAYQEFFSEGTYRPGIRTRDIDFLVPIPVAFKHSVNLSEILADLGFLLSLKGREGYMQFVHEELMIEFIVPERGRGTDKPYEIPALGVNAQPLRFMDFIIDHSMSARFGDIQVCVPHPATYSLLKLVVSLRRDKEVKTINDQRQGIQVIRALLDGGHELVLKETFLDMPKTWQKTALGLLSEMPLAEAAWKLLR